MDDDDLVTRSATDAVGITADAVSNLSKTLESVANRYKFIRPSISLVVIQTRSFVTTTRASRGSIKRSVADQPDLMAIRYIHRAGMFRALVDKATHIKTLADGLSAVLQNLIDHTTFNIIARVVWWHIRSRLRWLLLDLESLRTVVAIVQHVLLLESLLHEKRDDESWTENGVGRANHTNTVLSNEISLLGKFLKSQRRMLPMLLRSTSDLLGGQTDRFLDRAQVVLRLLVAGLVNDEHVPSL